MCAAFCRGKRGWVNKYIYKLVKSAIAMTWSLIVTYLCSHEKSKYMHKHIFQTRYTFTSFVYIYIYIYACVSISMSLRVCT